MKILWTVVVALICMSSHGEMRTWTSSSGQTMEGEYVTLIFGNVTIRMANGKELKVPFDSLSNEDRNYVSLRNPPTLKVEYRESTKPQTYVADAWVDNGGGSHDNHPVKVFYSKFGADIIQTSREPYDHELTVEIYVLSRQYYDSNNFHIIANMKSKPFKLKMGKENRFEYRDPIEYRTVQYNLYSTLPRGEELGEYLILVRDERGEIVAHRNSKNWLFDNLDKLSELPVGAWIDRKCVRIHPTSPKWDT